MFIRDKRRPVVMYTINAMQWNWISRADIYTIILLKSVGVPKRQIAILARSSREMYLTDRIVWQYIMSWVRVSVRPSNFFIREKRPNSLGNRVASTCCLFQWPNEMYLTDRIVWQYIMSWVRVSVRPSNFFIREKRPNSLGNRVASTCCLFQWPCYRLWMPAGRAVTGGCQWVALTCTAVATAVCEFVFLSMLRTWAVLKCLIWWAIVND